MSDFDPKDIHDAGDFDSADIHSEQSAPEVSKLESALRGAEQGSSFGLYDELAGGLSGAGRALGIKNLGGRLSDIGLAEGGPTLNPEELLNAYRATRDTERTRAETAAKANPYTTAAAGLAGGLAVPMGPLGSLFGTAAKGAPLAAKVAMGAKNAIVPGAIAGAGLSNADLTEGDIGGLAADTAAGGVGGAVIGGALPMAGAALSKGKEMITEGAKAAGRKVMSSAEGILPETPLEIYKRMLNEGVDVTSPEFYGKVGKEAEQTIGEVSAPMVKKIETQKAAQEAQKVAQAADVVKLEGEIADLNQIASSAMNRSQSKAQVASADELAQLAADQESFAQEAQKKLNTVNKLIKRQFDHNDKAVLQTGIKLDNTPIVSTLEQSMLDRGATPDDVRAVMKKVTPYFGDDSLAAYKNLKADLYNLFNHKDYVVRGAAKQAYGQLNDMASNNLRQAGFETLANNISQTNKSWGNMRQLEDQFISNISKNADDIGAGTAGVIKKYANETDIAKIADQNKFEKLLKNAMTIPGKQAPATGPQGTAAEDMIHQLRSLGQRARDVKVPEEVPLLPNPKLAQLEQQLAQVKGQVPPEITGLPMNMTSPEAVQKEVTNLLPKVGTQSGNIGAEGKLDQIFNFLKNEVGPDQAQALQEKATKTAKDLKLRSAVHGGSDESIPTSTAGLALKGVGGIDKAAAKLGKALLPKAMKVQDLAKSSPEDLTQLAGQFEATGAKPYAKVLNDASKASEVSRNAIIFGLMQQPDFRKYFNKVTGQEE